MEDVIKELVSIITDYGFRPDDITINTKAEIGTDKYLLEIKLRKYNEGYPTEGFITETIPVEIIEEVKKAGSGNVEVRQKHPVVDNDDLIRLVRKAGANAYVIDRKYEVIATNLKSALKRLAAFVEYPYTTTTGVSIFTADQFVSYFLRNKDIENRASSLVVEIPDFDVVAASLVEDNISEVDKSIEEISAFISESESKEFKEKVASLLDEELKPIMNLVKLQNPDLFSEELHEATLLSDLNTKVSTIVRDTIKSWGVENIEVETNLEKLNLVKGIATGTISCYNDKGYISVIASVKINPETYAIEGIDSPLLDLVKSRYGVSSFRFGSFKGEAVSSDAFVQALSEMYPDNAELRELLSNKWKPVRVIDSSNPDSLVTYWEVYRDPVTNRLYLKRSENQIKIE